MSRVLLALIALAAATAPAAAEPAASAIGESRDAVPAGAAARVWLGVQLGVPGQGSGIPLGGNHVPFGVAARYAVDDWRAIEVVLGPPVAGVGLGGWLGCELRTSVLGGRLALTATPGVRTGLAGTLYYARHSHVFVGYAYLYSGPWTIAPRASVGLAAPVVRGRVEAYLDGFVEEPLLPTPQTYLGADLGVRVRL